MPKRNLLIAPGRFAQVFSKIAVPQLRGRLTQPTLLPSRPSYP
jgi:hypothetical protein